MVQCQLGFQGDICLVYNTHLASENNLHSFDAVHERLQL